MEIWKPIPNYEGLYEISTSGHVRRIFGRTNPLPNPRPVKLLLDSDGYTMVILSSNAIVKSYRVHSLVAMVFLPPRPEGMIIAHINNDLADNRVENLEYVSLIEKQRRAKERGAWKLGEKRGHRERLTWGQVREIRRLYAEGGHSMRKLAIKYGVSSKTLRDVVNGDAWIDTP